jgi:ankyrin repeat protein
MNIELVKEMNMAIKSNDIEKVKRLIECNEGILNTITPFGTFLHYTSMFGMYDIVKLLIECGADVNIKGGSGDCGAITLAAFEGYKNIVELLYDNGATLDTSTFARNPLFAAIVDNHFDIVTYIVEKGIDIKASYAIGDIESCDAYEYARQYGRTEIAEYLKEKMEK